MTEPKKGLPVHEKTVGKRTFYSWYDPETGLGYVTVKVQGDNG